MTARTSRLLRPSPSGTRPTIILTTARRHTLLLRCRHLIRRSVPPERAGSSQPPLPRQQDRASRLGRPTHHKAGASIPWATAPTVAVTAFPSIRSRRRSPGRAIIPSKRLALTFDAPPPPSRSRLPLSTSSNVNNSVTRILPSRPRAPPSAPRPIPRRPSPPTPSHRGLHPTIHKHPPLQIALRPAHPTATTLTSRPRRKRPTPILRRATPPTASTLLTSNTWILGAYFRREVISGEAGSAALVVTTSSSEPRRRKALLRRRRRRDGLNRLPDR